MTDKNGAPDGNPRSWVASLMLTFSIAALTILAVVVIWASPSSAKDIFATVLPVLASWVGTILAFYFGRENFESASKQSRETNQQLQQMVDRLSPEERAKAPVAKVMRALVQVATVQIPQGKGEQDITLKDLRDKFTDTISRLPIVDADDKPKYMIHDSSVDKYLAEKGKDKDTTPLKTFLDDEKQKGNEYGLDKGFVVVAEAALLAEAKRKMEEAKVCQDIFVTKGGTPDEPLTGWISNVRMAKYLQA
jgi:hypothetical protein